MAGGYGGQAIALDVNNPVTDVASPLIAANQITAGNIQNRSAGLALGMEQMQRSALLNLLNSMNSPQPASQPVAQKGPAPTPPPTPPMLIQQAASDAKDADSWDANMTKLAQGGSPEAGQFIGRYSPQLQQRVISAYPVAPKVASPLASAGGTAPTSPLATSAPDPNSPPPSPFVAAAQNPNTPYASALRQYAALNPQGAAQLLSAQARIKFNQSGDPNDLRGDPTLMAAASKAMLDKTEAQQKQMATAGDFTARLAQQASTIPAGPQRDAYFKQGLQHGLESGYLTPESIQHEEVAGPISDGLIQRLRVGGQSLKDWYDMTGATAGAQEAAKQPFILQAIGATGAQTRQTQAAAPFNLTPGDQRFSPGGQNITPVGMLGTPAPAVGTTAPPVPSLAPIAQGANVGDIARQKAQADQFVKYQGELSDKAASAVQSNTDWDNMRATSQSWQQGKFADSIGDAKSYLVAMANQLGLPADQYTKQVADWQTFGKNAGALLRDAAHQVSSRVGVQEMQLVGRSLPTDLTSAKGFTQIADQMQGVNDFVLAKNAAASQFQGTQPQFEAAFDKAVSPVAFIVHRMSNDDYNTFKNNLNKTDAGRQELARIVSGMQYADQNGLFKAAGRE